MAWRVRKEREWVPQPSPVLFCCLYILNPLLTIKMDLLKPNIAIKVTAISIHLPGDLRLRHDNISADHHSRQRVMCQLTRCSLFQCMHMQKYHVIPIELLVSNLNKT